jgi:hypothetical protein
MTDQQASPSAPQSAAEANKASGRRTMTRWVQIIVGLGLGVLFIFILVAKIATRNDLPACDSTRAKDTLSDIFKNRNVDATRYDEIKGLTASDAEVTCNATLTLRNNSKLVIDYKLFREGDGMKLLITRSSP